MAGTQPGSMPMLDDLAKVIVSEKALQERVVELAWEIEAAYDSPDVGITVVAVLTGSVVFLSDLIRRLPFRLEIGYIAVSSYTGAVTAPQKTRLGAISLPEVRDRHVLIVDDILDTGGTLRLVQKMLLKRQPASLRTAVMLRKPDKAPADVSVDYVGFDIGDVFVVGYGLDFDGHYRNLPYIAELKAGRYGARANDAGTDGTT